MSRPFFRRCERYLRCGAASLQPLCCRPLFRVCLTVSMIPGILLAGLLFWKSVFYPASVPLPFPGGILLLWVLLSWSTPAFCAAALVSVPPRQGYLRLFPAAAALMLLAGLWCLLLLYHLPFCLCTLCAALTAVLALLSVPAAMRLSFAAGVLLLLCGVWSICLCAVSAGL